MKRKPEFENFEKAMKTVLKADPSEVKASIESEKREREEEARRTGKRGRGRPPKDAPSDPASDKD